MWPLKSPVTTVSLSFLICMTKLVIAALFPHKVVVRIKRGHACENEKDNIPWGLLILQALL